MRAGSRTGPTSLLGTLRPRRGSQPFRADVTEACRCTQEQLVLKQVLLCDCPPAQLAQVTAPRHR